MNKIALVSILILAHFGLFANEVTIQQAKQVAATQYQTLNPSASRSSVASQLVFTQSFTNSSNQSKPAFYVFNMNQNNGFIIVAGDDKITPILGYTDHGNFNINDIPRGLQKLFFQYKKGIAQIVNDNSVSNISLTTKWQNLKDGVIPMSASRSSGVGPLMTTEWSQRPNYNRMCPDNAPTGCVATAVAQIMKFYNHPQQGTGFHSFNHNDYGTLSANFGASQYEWNNMPNKLLASTPNNEKDAVSKLMYHVGVALEMNYSPTGSGASSSDVPDVLKDYFGYDNGISMKRRSSYTLTGWQNMIKDELDAGRVVYHRGYCPDPSAGHAFVVDGYDTTGKFHLNWGWSGSYNGFFEIDNLNPGSTYTWNDGQGAIIGIKPAVSNIDLKLFSNISLTPLQIDFNQPFTVDVEIANYGNTTFSGKVKAAIFDSLDNFVGDIEVLNGVSLSSLNYNPFTFSSPGMSITPGNYKVGIYVDLGNNKWTLVDEDSYNNPLDVMVSSTNNLGLISDGAILVNPDPIKQGQSFQVEIDIINTGAVAFNGQISVDIHEVNGDWIDEINHVTRTIAAGATENIVLNHTGLSLTPGTYELVIWHKPSGGSWEIIQEGTYPNSRNVDITGLDFTANLPDPYESNDTIINPYQFPLSFSGGVASIQTTDANIHLKGDKDYYSIHLDAGYEYLVYARVYDNYNDGGTGSYTNDMMFNYYYDTTKGNYYDDAEMPTILVDNVPTGGEDYIFEVVPFYTEDIGTYKIEIEVIRQSQTTGISSEETTGLNIYPNPANNYFNIKQEGYTSASIYSLDGALIETFNLTSEITKVETNSYKGGMYLIQLTGKNNAITKRVEVVK